MEVVLLFLFCLAVALPTLGVLCYNLGWRIARRGIAKRQDDLHATVEGMAVKHADDPRRFDIDTGKTYVTNRVRETLDQIDEEMT